jgi:opacity protein-like surface antigen
MNLPVTLSSLALSSSLLGIASTAGAQEPSAPAMIAADDGRDEDHDFYLSFSPLHLLPSPIIEVTGEWRLRDRIGLAAIAGAGRVDVDTAGEDDSVAMYEVGGQFIGYALGDFDHGLQVGGEAVFLHVTTDGETETLTGSAQGLAVGPFVGYKLATDVGFSFNVQVGAQYVAARGEDDEGESYGSAVIPLVNANLGWSF